MTSNYYDPQAAASTNYKEAFSLFDKRGHGFVPLSSLGDLLRACGQNPTLAEIRDLESVVGGGDFDFESFSKALNRPGGFRDPGDPRAYLAPFEVFDKEKTGFIAVGQFQYLMANMGEKMAAGEVDDTVKVAREHGYSKEMVRDGVMTECIEYEGYVNFILRN